MAKYLELPPAEELRRLFNYDGNTGELTRKVRVANRKAGSAVEYYNENGRSYVQIARKRYLRSRIVWKYFHGVDPENEIDHINRVVSDDRISNLREATHCENSMNRGRYSRNTSGFKGVYFAKREGLFVARITSNRKVKHLGEFLTADQAFMERCAAVCELHGDFAGSV